MRRLGELRREESIDLVVANAENAAGGAGLTTAIAHELLACGIDALTLGDHIWDQRGFPSEIGELARVCRPYNLAPQCPGRTHTVIEKGGFRLGVVTVLGRQFMDKIHADCPFRAADAKLRELRDQTDAVLLEVHAEATSEKIALGYYVDGRAAAVLGTHTHVPTADPCILARGTAYITDVGMTGPYHGVLGREMQPVIARFLDGMPRKFPVADMDARLCGCIVGIDRDSGLALEMRSVCLRQERERDTGT